MLVFIGWSGEESRAVAKILHEWLPQILQAVTTWMAPEGIAPAEYFVKVIAQKLEEADFGILCLNSYNFRNPWVLFEAGALAKSTDRASACPYLVGLKPSALESPLNNLQALSSTKEDTRRLVNEINSRLSPPLDEKRLDNSFERGWEKIEEGLRTLPKSKGAIFGGRVHFIFNRQSGLCLEATGRVREEGGGIGLKAFSGSDRQKWLLYETDDGYFTIESQHVKTSLDVDGSAIDKEAKVHLWPFHGHSNQRWQFVADKDGCYRLMRKKNRTFQLTASNGSLLQKPTQANDNQLWWLRAEVQ